MSEGEIYFCMKLVLKASPFIVKHSNFKANCLILTHHLSKQRIENELLDDFRFAKMKLMNLMTSLSQC